jgi:hypothetical protein
LICVSSASPRVRARGEGEEGNAGLRTFGIAYLAGM